MPFFIAMPVKISNLKRNLFTANNNFTNLTPPPHMLKDAILLNSAVILPGG
jgi:hypothetical protein